MEAAAQNWQVSWFKANTALANGGDSGNIEITTPDATTNDGTIFKQTSNLKFKALKSTDAGTDYSCKMVYAEPILSDQSSSGTIAVLGKFP